MESSTGALTDLDTASQPFVGRWDTLVSQTNWEKGQIILEWRRELQAAGAPANEYADDAWSRRVQGVTGQHVGRLRRVAERFSETHPQYKGLYWSHFQAAIEWSDAEMWLEGAVQNGWSIAQMRKVRGETMGQVLEGTAEEAAANEVDEDFVAEANADLSAVYPTEGEVRSGEGDGPEMERSERSEDESSDAGDDETANATAREEPRPPAPVVRPFADLPELPEDVGDAFESMKLAVLRHKSTGWKDIARDDMIAVLRALEELALAASGDEEAPF